MLVVVLQWCYLLCITYCLGFLFSLFCERIFRYQIKRAESYLLAGVVIVTVYAQFFSLFYKVAIAANVMLIVVMVAVILWKGGQLAERIRVFFQGSSVLYKCIILFLFLLWAYFTTRGYMTYDTDLYHGQSIHWIEDYGIVKGLGNLHKRFAYNSSIFALHALFSMKYLTGGISLHASNGFIAFLLTLSVLRLGDAWKRKKLYLSDYARIAAAYYLTMICDEILAPSSDYAVMCMIFYIIITWLELLEQKEESEKSIVPYCLLCVVGVYTLTLKLTAGLILLLLLKPAVYLLKHKKWKHIGIYLTLGIIVAAPWMIRSVIISGWLIYPLPQLDLFAVDWKMPAEVLRTDTAEIQTWGRALYSAAAVDVPITQWFGNWFRTVLLSTEKLLILADIASVFLFVIASVVIVVRKKWKNLDIMLVICTVACSYVYWQFSAPLTRYGYAYILLLVALMVGWFTTSVNFRWMDKVMRLGVFLVGVYKLLFIAQYAWAYSAHPYYIMPQDYTSFELEENKVDGQVIYTPVHGDRTGYYTFPAAPSVSAVELRGEDFEDGFRSTY